MWNKAALTSDEKRQTQSEYVWRCYQICIRPIVGDLMVNWKYTQYKASCLFCARFALLTVRAESEKCVCCNGSVKIIITDDLSCTRLPKMLLKWFRILCRCVFWCRFDFSFVYNARGVGLSLLFEMVFFSPFVVSILMLDACWYDSRSAFIPRSSHRADKSSMNINEIREHTFFGIFFVVCAWMWIEFGRFFFARPDMRVQSVYVWMFCLLAVFHIRLFHPQLFRWNVQLSSYLFSLNIFDEFVVFLLISLCGGSRSMNVKLIFFLVFFVSLLFEPVHIKENTVRTASIRHTMNRSTREDPISKVSEMCASPGMDFVCVRRAKCLCPLWIIAHCAQIQNDRLNNS